MPTKLSQILAVSKGAKNEQNAAITSAYHLIQKGGAFGGQIRTYQPNADDGVKLPGESQKVQARVADVIDSVKASWSRLFDVIATIDNTNCLAKANIIVDGAVIAADVPVVTLLALEKQAQDIITLIRKLPILDPSETWEYSDTGLVWQSEPVRTVRSEKVQEPLVLYPATDKHAAQTQLITRDVPAGTWTTVKLSGALPATQVKAWLEKALKLADAIKVAREHANGVEVVDLKIGDKIMGYVFG